MNGGRGRLYPPSTSSRWWVLGELRRAIEATIVTYRAGLADRVLVDLGCGDMPYRPLFEGLVRVYVGVDIATNGSADLHLDSGGRTPMPAGAAGVVLSTQVLEHALQPQEYLSEAARLLERGGLLILSTHGVWPFHPNPGDYRRWTSAGLRHELEAAGYDVLALRGIVGLPGTAVQLLQDALLGHRMGPLRDPFVLIAQRLMSMIDTRTRRDSKDRDACVYLVVASFGR